VLGGSRKSIEGKGGSSMEKMERNLWYSGLLINEIILKNGFALQ
jgi:hypothetical protein